ncbi:MAG: GntR family transcriptional regulator [Betaproteobacteria bacterium]|nr:GntR family transcriptional regulator [Betaproteobacteria bacterium]
MTKSHSTPTFRPLYEQIKILLTQSLIAGEWHPGEVIPSETELAGRFKVSQGTVRKAIDELAAENILVRRQGKGTFVATHTEEHTQYRFLRIIELNGKKESPSSVVLYCERGKADSTAAERLELKRGAPVVLVRRVLKFSGEPVILDDICLSATLFKGLTEALIAEFEGTLYSLYESRYGTRIIRAEERIRAVAADETFAGLLDIMPKAPLLEIDRVAYTYGDQPVEWRVSRCNTLHHCYLNELG